jgi:cystathionine gamma-synthase
MRFATRAVHAGLDPDPSYGSVIPAIHQTSTYAQPAPGEFVEDYDYARSANPTRAALERALGDLEGGLGVAFSSGLAAEHALITAVCSAGDHVLLPGDLYGGTYRLVDKLLSRWGLEYDLVDQTDLDALERALRPATRLIWVETPTNPLLNVVDVAGVVARKGGALVAVDNTFATPILCRPLEMGADLVVHSATKYLSGHADVVLGVAIARDPDLVERLVATRGTQGALPGLLESWLALRGLRTLHVRMERAQANAVELARRLAGHESVSRVRYPGFGAIVSVEIRGGADEATRVSEGTRLWVHATSLGGVESTLERRRRWPSEGAEVPDSLLRLSVGIEDVEDLWTDLSRALDPVLG